ncbi:unnamed protein product, partial [Effrenium voratum]
DRLLQSIVTRTCSTSQRKIARSKFYVGPLGSGTAPGTLQKEEALVSGFDLPDWDAPDEPPRIDLSQLTKRQLRRKWRLQRLKKAREFDELIEMYGYASSSPEPRNAKQSR